MNNKHIKYARTDSKNMEKIYERVFGNPTQNTNHLEVIDETFTEEQYKQLEFKHSSIQPTTISSEDILACMTLAVDVDDKQWFEELSAEYNRVRAKEEIIKAELGFNR